MFRGIVDSDQILHLNSAIAVLIQLLECSYCDGPPVVVHFPTNDPQELVILDISVPVQVECIEDGAHILRAHLCLEISAGFFKFCAGQSLRIVIVHDLEEPGETEQATSTPLSDLLPEDFQ